MPKRRPPSETWYKNIRPIIWKRDGKKCVRCGVELTLKKCHIDHITSGVKGSNKLINLRTLCRKCHTLRLDHNHRGMIQGAIKKGIVSPDWRKLIWDEEDKLKR